MADVSTQWLADLRPDDRTANRAYAHLGLLRNPFPTVGTAPIAPRFLPFGPIRGEIETYITRFVQQRDSQVLLISGSYGSGKTHLLRLIQQTLSRPVLRVKVIYLESAGYEVYSLLRSALDAFGRGEVTKIAWMCILDRLRSDVRAHGEDWALITFGSPKTQDVKVVKKRSNEKILMDDMFKEEPSHIQLAPLFKEEVLSDHRRFLAAYQAQRLSLLHLRDYAIRVLSEVLNCHAQVAELLFDSTDDDVLRAQVAWDRLTVSDEKQSPLKREREGHIMSLLLKLTEKSGNYDSFALLIDEFESITSSTHMTPRQTETYLRTLRLLLDKTWGSFPYMMALAITSEALDLILNQDRYPAFFQRPRQIELPVVDEEVAREFFASYLAEARTEPLPQGASELYPFTEDMLVAATHLKNKTPRALAEFGHDLVEFSHDRKLKPPIGAVEIGNFLHEREESTPNGTA